MSVQRIFSIFMALVSLLGFIGAASLKITVRHNLGPGFFPMIYSLTLFVLSVALFFSRQEKQPAFDWRACFHRPLLGGWIFYLLCFALYGLAYFFGFLPSMFIFGVVALSFLRRLKPAKAALFTIFWVAALYLVFAVWLHVPFPQPRLWG